MSRAPKVFPVEPLLRQVGASGFPTGTAVVSYATGIARQYLRDRHGMLTHRQAERAATSYGWWPHDVWPDWERPALAQRPVGSVTSPRPAPRSEALRSVPCPMCRVGPGECCRAIPGHRRSADDVVVTGREMVTVHPARVFALREQRETDQR